MSGADSLLPPEAYSTWVPLVGGLLLAAVAGWYAFVLLSTRRPRPEGTRRSAGDQRASYVAAVDAAYDSYRSEERDLRALHLELARIMREFASERLGRDVRTWTRAQIESYDPTAQLGELLALWEEPSFARRSDAEAETAARRAREVVRRW